MEKDNPSDINPAREKFFSGAFKLATIAAKSFHRPENLVEMTRDFLRLEAAGGIILVAAALLALLIANSPLYPLYNHILNEVYVNFGLTGKDGFTFGLQKSILHFVNDGLMAVFFFLVGLEIKREFVEGELSTRQTALLPLLAAIGGMAAPALIYYGFNQGDSAALRGWAIPAATDIAFALGVLSLLGNRVPVSLKALLLGIAVIDDLGAVVIIAIFFSKGIVLPALVMAGLCILTLIFLRVRRVSCLTPYILVTIILWAAVLESGVHATIAGVIAALFIPMRCHRDKEYSPLRKLEHELHPWVAFAVLPIFGFANAGVPFAGMGFEDLLNPVVLGIALGLFIGKQIGVFGMIALAIKTGLCKKPDGAGWVHLYAVSLLCGIGFTMSLFIGGLAFDAIEMQASVRLGVLIGSITSAVLAYLILRFSLSESKA